MKRHLLVAAVAALILPACDAVRLPGVNPAGAENDTVANPWEGAKTPPPETVVETTEETSQPVAVTDDPNTPDNPTTADDETPTEAQPDDPILEPESTVTLPLPPLAAMNARICSTGSDPAATPTVARVAGATEIEAPAFGTEAVNGLTASLSSFPGIVKVEPRRAQENGITQRGHCGATRIASNWLVTAAHCVDEPFDAIELIGAAADLRNPAASKSSASVAICHGGYDGIANGYGNDIALIRLSEDEAAALGDVPIASFGVTDMPLAPANYELGEMAGWGLTRYGGQLSDTLQTTTLVIERAGPALIYAASRNGAGPCVGDSGGPLYVTESDGRKTVVGLLSVVEQNRDTGEYCAGDYVGRYTNLQGYTDWIEAIMMRCDSEDEACQ